MTKSSEHPGLSTAPQGQRGRRYFSMTEIAARKVPVILEDHDGTRWELILWDDGVLVGCRAPTQEEGESDRRRSDPPFCELCGAAMADEWLKSLRTDHSEESVVPTPPSAEVDRK